MSKIKKYFADKIESIKYLRIVWRDDLLSKDRRTVIGFLFLFVIFIGALYKVIALAEDEWKWKKAFRQSFNFKYDPEDFDFEDYDEEDEDDDYDPLTDYDN